MWKENGIKISRFGQTRASWTMRAEFWRIFRGKRFFLYFPPIKTFGELGIDPWLRRHPRISQRRQRTISEGRGWDGREFRQKDWDKNIIYYYIFKTFAPFSQSKRISAKIHEWKTHFETSRQINYVFIFSSIVSVVMIAVTKNMELFLCLYHNFADWGFW